MNQRGNTAKKPKKSSRKLLKILFFVLLNVMVIGWMAFSELRKSGDHDLFGVKVNWIMLFPALGCLAATVLAESIKYNIILRKMSGKSDFGLAHRVYMLGRYFDFITPSGIGGQPYQIYYMSKNGQKAGSSLAVPMAGFITTQLSFGVVSLTVFILCSGSVRYSGLLIAAYIGLFLFLLFPGAIITFTLMPNFSEKMLGIFLRVGAKLRITKDVASSKEKYTHIFCDYRESILSAVHKKGLLPHSLLLSIIYQIAVCSIPFFAIKLFGGGISYLTAFTTTVFISASVTFVPTPGNTGAAEGAFYAMFSALASGNMFFAMLVWRFFCYYFFLLCGILISTVDLFKSKSHSYHD